MAHLIAEVRQVVRDGGAQAQEARAVVAVGVLPGAIAHESLRGGVKGGGDDVSHCPILYKYGSGSPELGCTSQGW